MGSGYVRLSMMLAYTSHLSRIRMLPTALNRSFCRPLHVHIHERTSRLNQLRHRENLTEWYRILVRDKTRSFTYLPTSLTPPAQRSSSTRTMRLECGSAEYCGVHCT